MSCDCELPVVYEESTPRARVSHMCGECGNPIDIGERYWKIRGLWDGKFETYKMCLSCKKIADEIDGCFCFGDVLYEAEELGIGELK